MQQETPSDEGSSPAPLIRGVQYVRMSTEHQQYSTENQRDKILEYAARRGIEVVRTYADEGKSGLRIDGRQTRKVQLTGNRRRRSSHLTPRSRRPGRLGGR